MYMYKVVSTVDLCVITLILTQGIAYPLRK